MLCALHLKSNEFLFNLDLWLKAPETCIFHNLEKNMVGFLVTQLSEYIIQSSNQCKVGIKMTHRFAIFGYNKKLKMNCKMQNVQ